jgi:hypothetical protein
MSERLVEAATSFFQRRVSRRGMLVRLAIAGSAMAVAPLRYLVEPVDAMSFVNCPNCRRGSRCCDGYTTFCCTLTGVNVCPANTYVGGWWKCTSYTGDGICAAEGVRYYMDCNILPGWRCPGGCHCANNNCSHRRTCCNIFRYGQCGSDVRGVTPIVCRVIKCVNPCSIYSDCTCSYKQDNNTCKHEEGALCL